MSKEVSTYILAEMASSHEGDPKIAQFIIEAAAKAEADGILVQLFHLDTYVIPSDEDYGLIKRLYLDQKAWAGLIAKANSLGLDVWANAADIESTKFCVDKPIRGFKLHSALLENVKLVQEVAKSRKELLLSIGGTEKEAIKETLDSIYSINKEAKIHLMYGLQNFPTNPEGVNINFVKELSKDLNVPFGYQDHSEPISPASTYLPVLFMAQGATIIEKHITHDRGLKGIDYEAALNPDEFADFVRNIRIVDSILKKGVDNVSVDELKYRAYKSLIKVVAQRDIEVGEVFSEDNLTVMRAKKGEIGGKQLRLLMNKRSKSPYQRFEPIKGSELSKVRTEQSNTTETRA